MAFKLAATMDDVWEGELYGCKVGTMPVLLVRFGSTVFAYEDRCAHLGVPLSKGSIDGHVITCGMHEWKFDARAGSGINPAKACMTRFPVRIEKSEIWVDVG